MVARRVRHNAILTDIVELEIKVNSDGFFGSALTVGNYYSSLSKYARLPFVIADCRSSSQCYIGSYSWINNGKNVDALLNFNIYLKGRHNENLVPGNTLLAKKKIRPKKYF